MSTRRLILAMLTAWTVGTSVVHAGNLDRTTEGQDVTVTISSPFSNIPPGGCVPFRVSIRNDRNEPGTWQLTFQGIANVSSLGATVYQQDLSVGPNTTANFEVLAPLPAVSADRGNTVLNVGILGPGFNPNSNRNFFAYFYTNNPGSRSPFTVIGNDVLGPIGLGPMTSYCKKAGHEFYGSDVDIDRLPSDWKAYSGVAALILKDSGWLGLNSAQRGAICDYVSQGGHLTLITAEDPVAKAPELQLPGSDGKPGPYGFGAITLIQSAVSPPEPLTLYMASQDNPLNSAYNVDDNFSTWGLRKTAGEIAISGAFILSFVVLFGSLVGPVNLFVFARGSKRFRLFWTTPLISIIACLALIIGILFTDGIGGSGKQMIVFYSLPGVNREAVIQEQVARTAVLFANHWHNDQDYLMTPVSPHAMDDALAPAGRRVYGPRSNLDNSPDVYRQAGHEYSGNWFRSRSIQGQYLQAVHPSRSALTVLNPQALNASGDAPVVLSSFPQELTQVFLIDSRRQYWTCGPLEPGRKKTCVASTLTEFNTFWNRASVNAGGKLEPFLNKVRNQSGMFYATGLPSASETLATLGEIRWQVATGLYLGPWVNSPTEETTP